jgi:cysteinyl-tRNA synthetase
MSNTLLGKTLDIHSGGEDLMFPHHENEIAQSEAHNNAQFARFWMHCKHLIVDGNKMSKSLGNFYTLKDIENKKYNPLAVKLLFYMSHYRSQLNFTFDGLDDAQKKITDINKTIAKLSNYYVDLQEDNFDSKVADKFLKDFVSALEDDLNTPKAFASFYEFLSFVNSLISNSKITEKSAKKLLTYFKKYDLLLGLFDFPEKVEKEVVGLCQERYLARKRKDFATSDQIRDKLSKTAYKVDDLPNGFTITYT